MLIARGMLYDPARNTIFAVSAVALSVFVLAYSSRLGQVSVLAYYAVWLPLIALDPQRIVGNPRALLLPAAFVAFVLASVLWSASPATTLRGGIQFLTHALCVLVAVRICTIRTLTLGFVLGTLAVILYSLVFGYSAYDVMDGSYTFVGAFGSKNQLGLFCSLGIYFCVILVLLMRERWPLKLGAMALAALFMLVLVSSRSATSIIALALALLVLVALLGFLRFSPLHRLALVVVVLPLALAAAGAALQFGLADAVLALFGKDTTLTGRTYLWNEGMTAAATTPLLGVGYLAYWVQGFPEAERLWEEFYIASRTGFHFHNTFVESLVELGAAGTAILAALFVGILVRLSARVVRARDSEAACFLGLFVLLLIRSMSEVDVLFPYTVGSFLLLYLHVAARRRDQGAALSTGRSGSPQFAGRAATFGTS